MQRRPASLTTRLGLLFAIVATLTFVAVGTYLYQSLATQLEARDDAELLENIGHVRHLLQETPSIESIRQDPHRFVDAAARHEGLILVLKAADGAALIPKQARIDSLPPLPMAASDQTPDDASVRTWRLPSGTPARIAAAWGRVGDNTQEQVQIIVARSAAARQGLLKSYHHSVFAAVLSGAFLAGLLGYLLVRRGLLPIRVIADQAHSITAQRLDMRLDAAAAPQELQMLVQAFNAMLDRLYDSFQRLSQFSADLAHDFRTPINNLMVQTQVALVQSRSADDYQALLASNVEEYERLARMIESMLFLARADHAHVALNRQPADIRNELQRIADYFEGIAEEAGVTLSVEAGDTVTADAALFRRAVNNLVANAIRHALPGSIVRMFSGMEDHAVVVAVSNHGSAIDETHIPRLFDRFYRADQSRSDSASSTGLGLSIVQSIMTLHGGRIEVDCNAGITTFRLLFPQVAAADPASRARPER
jgi:two-component system, OmpR family, heavy metal sensor histidine kinase CusS